MKRFALFLLALSALSPALAQDGVVYTRIAHWTVPRAQIGEQNAYYEKNVVPLMEKLVADGTIMHWGIDVPVVHADDGRTHGLWWAATSLAGLEKARATFSSLPPDPVQPTKHHDHFFVSIKHGARSTPTTKGFISSSSHHAKPGRGGDWNALFEKHIQPFYQEQLESGNIVLWELSAEYVHRSDPNWRYVWHIAPSAEAQDRFEAAFGKFLESQPTLLAAFGDASIITDHRDNMGRVGAFSHK